MKKLSKLSNIIYITAVVLFLSASCTQTDNSKVSSPNGELSVNVFLNDSSQVFYQVTKGEETVIEPSQLGIIREDADFSTNLSFKNISEVTLVEDEYTLKVHKQDKYHYKANQKIYTVVNTQGIEMEIIFQVSDKGVAFRYRFPANSDDIKYIHKELTSFAFNSEAKAWLQPIAIAKSGWGQSNPSYEEHYLQDIPVGTSSPLAGWVFPALFKTNDHWVLISETDVDENYCGSKLTTISPKGVYSIAFPNKKEVIFNGELNPQSTLPWETPWRIMAIGSLADIAESTLGTDLAAPAIEGDFSWVKPGISSWSWVLLKDGSIVYPVQKKFIDYSAEMGWDYCLVDNYWDTQIGFDKIKELGKYASDKGVKLILWYNSAGDWNTTPQTPKDKMLTEGSRMDEFKKIKEIGVGGVKVDFFGGDGQSVMKYYHEILQSAAKAGIMVNFHGCTLPRGWHRTYPNLMTMESVKGMEYTTFSQADQNPVANHATMLPFTRNVYDPMDFTPVCFGEIFNIKRVTTNGFEIALPVIFQSGIQHIAEVPDVMMMQPDYVKEFMSTVPVVWDKTKLIDGYPGKFVVMARKSGETWYVAGINGQDENIEVTLDLSFIGKTKGTLITDGAEKRSFKQETVTMSDDKSSTIEMQAHGGFVLTF